MREYYYIDATGNQVGPLTADELKLHNLTPQTPVWYEGLSDWTPAGTLPDVASLFNGQVAGRNGLAETAAPNTSYDGQQQGNSYGNSYGNGQYGGTYAGGNGQYGGSQYGGQQYSGTYGSNPYGGMMQKPHNWLPGAIICTLLCCLPFGIVGIVYAAKVDSLWSQGLYQESIKAANNARLWTIIGAACGFVAILVWFIICLVAGIGFGSATDPYYYYEY